MKVLLNFANENFRKQQKFNTATGYKIGKFDKVIEYGPNDIDEKFKEENEKILSVKRGFGLWLWKPYIILKTLNNTSENDYIYYSDAGVYFLKPIDLLISVMNRDNIDVMCFENCLLEKDYTSQFCFDKMGCDDEKFKFTMQRETGYILLKNNYKTKELVKEWLDLCKNYELLSGGPLGDAIAHREDQSIWSLLTKKKGIQAYRCPSQYAYFYKPYLEWTKIHKNPALIGFSKDDLSTYPTIVYLYRKGKEYRFFKRIKSRIRYEILDFFRKRM